MEGKTARIAIATAALALAAAFVPAAALANSSPTTGADFYRVSSAKHVLRVAAPGVLGNDADPDGDELRALPMGSPGGGVVRLARDGSFLFRPNPGFSGLYTFDYLASDGVSVSTYGHVYIGVTKPPVAHDDDYAALTRTPRSIPAPGVLANDEGADRARPLTPPAHGELNLRVDGSFVYRSEPGFTGTDSFDYSAVVQGEPRSTGTVEIRVKASNDPPVAVDDQFSTPEDTSLGILAPGVLANDTDADGDPLTVELLSSPLGEDFQFYPDGAFDFTPPFNYDSPVDFTYRVNDGLSWSAPATAVIAIPAVDDAPYAEGDQYELFRAGSINVPAPGVLANDYDEVESDALSAALRTPPQHGTVRLRRDGSFVYRQSSGPVQADAFSYLVSDSGGASGNIAWVQISP